MTENKEMQLIKCYLFNMELGDTIYYEMRNKISDNIWFVLADENLNIQTEIGNEINEEIWEKQIIFPSRGEMI